MPRNFSNIASGATLAGAIAAGATSVLLDNFANYPAAPFAATIGRNTATEEIVLVTAVAGSTVTMTRGYDGTTAQAHSAGGTFEHTAIAKDFRDASAHVEATGMVHGLAGDIVGTTDVQTLTNKTVQALLAMGTASAPALTADSAAGTTTKLLSLKQNGVEKAFVDHLGNLTAAGVTGTNASFSGTLGVTGATTLAGLLAANGGITVPTGKKVTLTDAPTAGTDAANKAYADALGTASATADTIARRNSSGDSAFREVTLTQQTTSASATRKDYVDGRDTALATIAGASRVLAAHHGSGTAFPVAGLRNGDTYEHTGLGSVMRYNGTAWRQVEIGSVADNAAMTALSTNYSAVLHDGFQVYHVGNNIVCTWRATSPAGWSYVLTGSAVGASDVDGVMAVPHWGHTTPGSWGVNFSGGSTDAQSTITTAICYFQDATSIFPRFVRMDTHTFFQNPGLSVRWWARW